MGRAKEWVVQQKILLQRIGAVALALALWQLLAMAVWQQLLVPTPLSVVSGWEPSGKRMGFGPPFGSPFGRLSPGSCWGWGSDWGLAPWRGGFPCLRFCFALGR